MRAWLEINLDSLEHNYDVVKQRIGRDIGVIAVVKSDAYGHSLPLVTKRLDQCGVDMFAVFTIDEALEVQKLSRRPILIMGYLDPKALQTAIEGGFVISVYDREMLAGLEKLTARIGRVARIHLKIETGLNRLGMSVDEAVEYLLNQHHYPHVVVEAVYSHLAKADDYKTSYGQLRLMQQLIMATQNKTDILPMHLASSYALKKFDEGFLDAVRVGMALYGSDEVLPGASGGFKL